jgi:hypothetical protein
MRFAMCNKTRLQVQMRVNRRAVALQNSAEREIYNITLSRVVLGRRRRGNREICDIQQMYLKIKNGPESGLVRNLVQSYNYNGIRGEE